MSARLLALEALKAMQAEASARNCGLRICDEAIVALLSETGEPVAWRIWSPDGANVYQYTEDGDGEPLYTAPPPAAILKEVTEALAARLGTNADEWPLVNRARAIVDGAA